MSELPAIEGGTPVRDRDRFLVFGAPDLLQEDVDAVVDCMQRRWIGTGPKVREFEQAFAAYKGVEHAVAVNSCTAAMHLSMIALNIGRGHEVITTAMTFCSSVNAILHAGASAVLVDCDPRTMNIDPAAIEACITPRTRAILVVHFCGRSCDMDAVMAIARRHDLLVIEDCAHAIETESRGRKAGTIGDVGCFSFYVTKNVTTGEGGMVTTRNPEIADRIKVLALHGMSKDAWRRFSDSGYKHYQVVYPGYKYNMMDMCAAIGLGQLRRVDAYHRRRAAIWDHYCREFADLPCRVPAPPEPDGVHAFHLFTPLLETDRLRVDRDFVLEAMTAENIGIGVHYVPVHLHPYYEQNLGLRRGDYPNAEEVGASTLSLPLSGCLTDDEVDDVCRSFRRVLTYFGR